MITRRQLHSGDPALTALGVVVLLSFIFWPLALLMGFNATPEHAPEGYRTYFESNNWWPFPFFFLALAPGLSLTWRPFLRAWARLAETGVLKGPSGKPDAAAVRAVQNAVKRRRWIAFVAALVIALVINGLDFAPRAAIYIGGATFGEQLDFACDYPDPFVKWIFEERQQDTKILCVNRGKAEEQVQHRPNARVEHALGISAPPAQLLFVAIALLQQFLVVFFSALAVIQLLLHTLIFAGFERLRIAGRLGLRLELNCTSPLNEFGLEHWNYELNNFYWAVCPALLGVFLSRASVPMEDYLPGQVILGIAVPTVLLLPMIFTIIVRQARLPQAWSTLQPRGSVDAEDYLRQQLWPFDRNWTTKLGIILAFSLSAFALGVELSKLIKL